VADSPFDLTGRRALVTGSTRGIGAAIAAGLARAGATVVLHGRDLARVDQARGQLAADVPGADVRSCAFDVADHAAVAEQARRLEGELGGIDVLVNNAGVYEPHAAAETTYEEWQDAWRHTLAVNLVGAANVTWCVLRHMGPGGRIVNVASRGAFRGEPNHPAYGASKAGLIAFGQSLARALGERQISVTAVAPGFVETEMAAAELEGESGRQRRAESPLGRVARPEEVAAAVYYLASPEAELASGAVLDVNGASYLRM
jgi:3-oxoacyl-[acyl-carrier protein] reductase